MLRCASCWTSVLNWTWNESDAVSLQALPLSELQKALRS